VEPPRILNVADGTPLTVAECARLVARADGRVFPATPSRSTDTPSASEDTRRGSPARSNQRIRIGALRALGWAPTVPTLHTGLVRLGYTRLADGQLPYGPQTPAIRAFLRALAALDATARHAAVEAWQAMADTPALQRADRLLGEVLARAGREAERDAAAGPLLQLVRTATPGPDATDANPPASPALDPLAEPALASLMALVVRDLLPPATFDVLVAPLAAIVPTADDDARAGAVRDAVS
jgi:hypothetical protein